MSFSYCLSNCPESPLRRDPVLTSPSCSTPRVGLWLLTVHALLGQPVHPTDFAVVPVLWLPNHTPALCRDRAAMTLPTSLLSPSGLFQPTRRTIPGLPFSSLSLKSRFCWKSELGFPGFRWNCQTPHVRCTWLPLKTFQRFMGWSFAGSPREVTFTFKLVMKFSYAGLAEWGSLYLLWDGLLGGDGGCLLNLERITKVSQRGGCLLCVTLSQVSLWPQPGTLHLICHDADSCQLSINSKRTSWIALFPLWGPPSGRMWSPWPWRGDPSTNNPLSTGHLYGAVSWNLGQSLIRAHVAPSPGWLRTRSQPWRLSSRVVWSLSWLSKENLAGSSLKPHHCPPSTLPPSAFRPHPRKASWSSHAGFPSSLFCILLYFVS